jgi:N6-L-threonylcarbamoyladenine synthase
MKFLAIETSCDDTAIAILQENKGIFKVLANIVSSQTIHQNYGGVFPMMAKREHQKNLVPVLMQALTEAGLENKKPQSLTAKKMETLQKMLEREQELFVQLVEFLQTYEKPNIDAIAVTYGPGLEPCLWVGVNFARALSYVWNLPLIPVNHIEAHILVNLLQNKGIEFPAISLVVSGGHTQLILVKGIGKYKIIGETRDDAAGECFDKCAKLLGLGYPGGPIISKIASEVTQSPVHLPRPMFNTKDYDFSFSGLKTAVLHEVKEKELTSQYVKDVSFEVQQAIIDVLLKKTLQAAKDFKAKTIILGGGVSANQELRKQFTTKADIPVIFPELKLSTDNALMIAVTAALRTKKKRWQSLKANANARVGTKT